MRGQYDVTYKIPGMQYTPSMPVMVSGGNLLRDNINGLFLAQLKLQNIYHRVLNGIDVQILVYDSMGNLIETRSYRYEGLRLGRDQFAGMDVAVPLNDSRCASLSVKVTGVFDADGRYLQANPSAELLQIELRDLKSVWKHDPEMLKQYQLEHGKNHKAVACEVADRWICSCGTVNSQEEASCHVCGCSKEAVLHPDLNKIEKDKQIRLEKEKQEKESIKAKKKMIAIISGACILAVIIVSILITQVFIPERNYREAVGLFASGNYQQAYERFYNLDDYKDSQAYLIKAKREHWKKSYKSMLSGKTEVALPDSLDGFLDQPISSTETRFSIVDLDQDDIPELLVQLDNNLVIYTVKDDGYGYLDELPWVNGDLYVGDPKEIGYYKDPAYIFHSYYEDGLYSAEWASYPKYTNDTFWMNEIKSWDETYMAYQIERSDEEFYESYEEEFNEALDSTLSGEYKTLRFHNNSETNRETIITQ